VAGKMASAGSGVDVGMVLMKCIHAHVSEKPSGSSSTVQSRDSGNRDLSTPVVGSYAEVIGVRSAQNELHLKKKSIL